MTAFAFIGFGELGSVLAKGLRENGAEGLRAYVRPRPDQRALALRLAAAHVERAPSVEIAVRDADVVLVVVPGSAVVEVARGAAPHVRAGSLYVDAATAAPEAKGEAGALVGDAGALYVDAAVLGAVAADGYAVPFLASGPGAEAWADLMAPYGLCLETMDGPAGSASRVKLLRSVYMKGRDALVLEMLVAARRYGVERELIESVKGAGEGVPFPELADRVLRSLAVHAGRRSEELEAAAEVLRAAGIEPVVAEAGAERLRRLAELGLRERFGGERPEAVEDVLRAIDELGGSL